MLEQVSNYEQEIEFIVGFAGSGKSTELAERFSSTKALVLTPTHKSKDVLIAKGVKNAVTIHSVLKLVPTLNQEMRRGQKMRKLRKIGDIDLSDIDIIGIDEFSMINVSILDMLLELLPEDCKVTIFGDPYQLKPVDGELIDPAYYTDNITELTTQHRAEAPDVVETFMRFKDFIKGTGQMDLRVDLPQGSLKGFDPKTDRALAFTNKKVLELNEAIAQELGLPREIAIGEEISINGLVGKLVGMPEDFLTIDHIYPKCVAKGKLMQGAKLEDTIGKIQKDMRKFNNNISSWDIGYIEIEETVYSFSYNLDHYAHAKTLMTTVEEVQFGLIDHHNLADGINLKEWCQNNMKKKFVENRGTAWKQYLTHEGLIWDLRRPFASTVHRSQGSEFDYVYIAQADIKKAIRKGWYMNYARLMYVSLSRAIKGVIIVD